MGFKVVCRRSLQLSRFVIAHPWKKWWRITGSFQLSSFYILWWNNNLCDMWDFQLLVNFRKLLCKRMLLHCLHWYKPTKPLIVVLLKWLPWKPGRIIWQILVVFSYFLSLDCSLDILCFVKKKIFLKIACSVVCKSNSFVNVTTKLSWPLRGSNKRVGRFHLPSHTKWNLVQ